MGYAFLCPNAMVVEIEYCVPCGLLEPAIDTERALLEEFGEDLDGVRLTPGDGGVFKVAVDGDVIYDKAEHGNEIKLDEITDAIDNGTSAEA